MGSCCSTPSERESAPDSIPNGFTEISGNRRLLPFKAYIKPPPESPSKILEKRQTFWDTQPFYSGIQEIWQTLKIACEAESIEEAQAFVDSANITVPTGMFTDGCYDSLGNHYVIPDYCIGPLKVADKEVSITEVPFDDIKEIVIDESAAYSLKVRISTGVDIEITVSPNLTLQQVQQLIRTKMNWPTSQIFTIIHFGKSPNLKSKLSETQIDGSTLLQVFVKL